MMDGESGDGEGDEGSNWLRRGCRYETGILFQRWGHSYRNEQYVIFKEEVVGSKSDNRGSASTARWLERDWAM